MCLLSHYKTYNMEWDAKASYLCLGKLSYSFPSLNQLPKFYLLTVNVMIVLQVPSMLSCSTTSLLLRHIHCLQLLSYIKLHWCSASYIPRTVSWMAAASTLSRSSLSSNSIYIPSECCSFSTVQPLTTARTACSYWNLSAHFTVTSLSEFVASLGSLTLVCVDFEMKPAFTGSKQMSL